HLSHAISPCPPHPPHPHSFPTRRSSDLPNFHFPTLTKQIPQWKQRNSVVFSGQLEGGIPYVMITTWASDESKSHEALFDVLKDRSEEHTSELQSRFDLVCRLLLEKKKKK